jgi:chloramphenicol-sensitive protein RarD
MKDLSKGTQGAIYATMAYVFWGLVPLFWSLFKAIPPLQILGHRMVWSFVFFVLLFWYKGKLGHIISSLKTKGVLSSNTPSALLIGSNWGLYIFAVNSGYAVESSLGYFISPILNVIVGSLAFKEPIRKLQWTAFTLALMGVLWMGLAQNSLPWVAMLLASTFCLYGVLKKKNPLSGLESIAIECTVLLPIAGILLFSSEISPIDLLSLPNGVSLTILITLGGALTALPLIWFSEAAQKLPLSTLGFFQYLSPSLQLIIAVFVFKEPLKQSKLFAFILIWTGLAIFMMDSLKHYRRNSSRI